MAVTNLSQYYSSIGQALPSVQQRAGIYQNYGLGSSNSYVGSAAQNTALLGALQKGSASAAPKAKTTSDIIAKANAGYDKALADFKSEQAAKDKALIDAQNAKSTDFLNRYTSAINGQESLESMANRISQELGLPDTQQAYTGIQQALIKLQGTLANLPEQVQNETRGFDVNAAQLAKIQENRADPLNRQVNNLANSGAYVGQQLSGLEKSLTDRLGYAVSDQQKQLQPFSVEAGLLSDALAREVSLYSTDKEQQFNGLLAKLNAGHDLTMSEVEQLQKLALQEDQYEKEKQLASYKASLGGGEGSTTPTPSINIPSTSRSSVVSLDDLAASSGLSSNYKKDNGAPMVNGLPSFGYIDLTNPDIQIGG